MAAGSNSISAPYCLRSRIEDQIDKLIAMLDAMDGDPDLEDGHDAEDDPADLGIADDGGLCEQRMRFSALRAGVL